MEKEQKLKPVPEVGKEYHLWDDGKTALSRHYICRVERVLTPKDAMSENIEVTVHDNNSNNEWVHNSSLKI